jgi:hypothetical protein
MLFLTTSKNSKAIDRSQLDSFKEAARKLGCDEDEVAFAEKLKVIARQKPSPIKPAQR